MVGKSYVTLLSLWLALAPGCNSGGGSEAHAPSRPSATQQAAADSTAPVAVPPSPEGAASASAGGKSDACHLLTPEDIEAVQGEAVKEAKGSEQADGALLIGQCFYMTASFNKSVSLTLTQKNAASAEAGGPKDFWKRQFGGERERERESGRRHEGEREREKEREREREGGEGREGEEEESPAQPVKGVGDSAYWVGNQKVGVLYVLKGDRFLRISIGGPDGQQAKIEKMKELAKRALKRI
jgi:hypothetical protein